MHQEAWLIESGTRLIHSLHDNSLIIVTSDAESENETNLQPSKVSETSSTTELVTYCSTPVSIPVSQVDEEKKLTKRLRKQRYRAKRKERLQQDARAES